MFRIFIVIITAISSIIAGFYIGGWLMIIKPILTACAAFDAGTLTGLMIGRTILICCFGGTVGSIIIAVGMGIAEAIMEW